MGIFGNKPLLYNRTMTIQILGLDVSSNFVAACLLDHRPDNLLEYFRANRKSILKIEPNMDGIKTMLAMSPNFAVMEPTGVNYSKIWAEILTNHGCQILWVGHSNLKAWRNAHKMPNKNDYADAAALAHYGYTNLGKDNYFLRFNPFELQGDLRALALQLCHLNRVQSPIVNRIWQALAYEMPELCEVSAKRGDYGAPLWRWIAGEPVTTQTKNRFNRIADNSIGTGISKFTRNHARRLLEIHQQEIDIEADILAIAQQEIFKPYHNAFDRFGFGDRVRAMILSTIYPLQSYLGDEGKPIVEIVDNLKATKKSKRHRSLSSFKLALGHGMVEDTSGKSVDWINGGSKLCRIALWQWLFTSVEVRRCRKTDYLRCFGAELDTLKEKGVPVKLARSKVLSRVIRRLFYDLVESIND